MQRPLRVGRIGAIPVSAGLTINAKSREFRLEGLCGGMMADFVQALSEREGGEEAVGALFQSADAVVRMWETCEALAPLVD